MLGITGTKTSRPVEALTRSLTVIAVFVAVLVPVVAGFVLLGLGAAMAAVAPDGKRGIAVVAAWIPVSAAVLGTTIIA